ncbi:polysaccharide pyruvyl transferase family protein [Klebsiella quasipneumoniae]|uniref:polysaccharide pyruvyl transferase family protein n=1 Tax=Klebsiella quasipneumoniae TaxID=1463165 RepID=UPI000D74CE07|nr:polysaccharide pyruvyl transferase family protein [Klebsiella quasipneumoniae]PXI35843.1 polysaccharide pyruvyl transferase family protein [Klebsiella quasipneumoniae]
MKEVKVHWCNIENFGDALNPYLISKISGLPVKYRNYKTPSYYKELRSLAKCILTFKKYDFNRMLPYNRRESVVLGIGSLLDRSRSNFSVWGSGYMNNFERAEGGTLHAVRGRFSAEKLLKEGFPYCSVWGDPGLLLPRVYCPKKNKHYKVGIIPHLKDYDYFKNKYKSNKNIKVIDLKTKDIEFVVDEIISCEYILSTSLHGVIVAQAYDIPTLWIKHNDINTDGIKFYDYFDSVGIKPYDGFEDYESLINDYESAFVKHANISKITTDLKQMQDNLLSVAPFPVLDKFK